MGSTGTRAYKRITPDYSLRIGCYGLGTRDFLNGYLSDYQIWDKNFTQEDVTFDYLNPESLALNNGGTSLTESNLRLWYPMNDGHRGQQSYILDASNTGLGDELISNGDFSNGITSWTAASSGDGVTPVAYNGGVRISSVSGGNSYILQNIMKEGVTYKIQYEITENVAGSLTIESGVNTQLDSTVGTHSLYFTWDESDTAIVFKRTSGATDITIDNISVKAINDKNHATTVFYGDEQILSLIHI